MNYYVGWDVGAWKCTKGRNESCDSIVVLNDSGMVGHYRDNISMVLGSLSESPPDQRHISLVNDWFSLCKPADKTFRYSDSDQYYIAIDTPLGWPRDFKALLNGKAPDKWNYQPDDANIRNSLLYRYTERNKLGAGLSVIVDSIGSQSVKGILLLELLGAKQIEWGVWKAENITLFETYPKACLVRPSFVEWIASQKLSYDLSESFTTLLSTKPNKYGKISIIAEDLFDAGVCACVAKAFAEGKPKLVSPTELDPQEYSCEGWIFYPDESSSLCKQGIADGHKSMTCCEGNVTFHEAILAFQKHIASKTMR